MLSSGSNISNLPEKDKDSHDLDFSKLAFTTKDFEKEAFKELEPNVLSYFRSGADEEITLHNNSKAFESIKLYPRVLRNITAIETSTEILKNEKVDLPFGIAPFAMQKLIKKKGEKLEDSKGEMITAAEASRRNTAFGLSMMSTTSIPEIERVNPNGLKIMQLYFLQNSEYTQQIIQHAEKHNFKALAITVDTQSFGKRRQDERNTFSPNVELEVFKQLGIPLKFRNNEQKNMSFVHTVKNNITWDDIDNIKNYLSKDKPPLKIILKGLINPDDVEKAFQHNVDAIWISNHGGRQLDTAPATIWMLPIIRKKVDEFNKIYHNQRNNKMEIYIDGGVWKGSDIFKCIALGADFVFIGRAFLYSLIEKEKGISKCFDILEKELKITMALTGCRNIKEIREQKCIWNSCDWLNEQVQEQRSRL